MQVVGGCLKLLRDNTLQNLLFNYPCQPIPGYSNPLSKMFNLLIPLSRYSYEPEIIEGYCLASDCMAVKQSLVHQSNPETLILLPDCVDKKMNLLLLAFC